MTFKEVLSRVEQIRERSRDDGWAHHAEDALHQDVLRAIADGRCSDPVAFAQMALATLDIDFARWFG